jgi:hypothetical protein
MSLRIDKSIDVETEDVGFSPDNETDANRHVAGELIFQADKRPIAGQTCGGKSMFIGGAAFEELGRTVAVDGEGKRIQAPAANKLARALKTDATRDYDLRLQEWFLGDLSVEDGRRTLPALGLKTLAHLFGQGVLEFSDESIRAVCKKFQAEQSNLSKQLKKWEEHFGVEIGHCRHGEKKPDPLNIHKKGKKKHHCKNCFANGVKDVTFWTDKSVQRDDVTCPRCSNPAYTVALYCEDCTFPFNAVLSKPKCPKCGHKVKVPAGAISEDEEEETTTTE